MTKVYPTGPITRGIDVSHYQGKIDWSKVDVQFCFMKASEGHYQDPLFKSNWSACKEHGIIRGAYHFYRAGISYQDQADNFMRTVGTLSPDDLPLALDWEIKADPEDVLAFLDTLKIMTLKIPILYTGPSFVESMKIGLEFAAYPLWVSHYTSGGPLVPYPWKNWSFWQYSSNETDMHCDVDLFNGSIDSLKQWSSK